MGHAAPAPEERILAIGVVGARGDATAEGPEGPVYLAYALPGERVRARLTGGRGELLEVLTPSDERQPAPCRHFGQCGGCQLQHWREEAYLSWKRAQVQTALERRGLGGIEVDPILPAWGEGRRRAGFHAVRQGEHVRLGFIERGGARLVPIQHCPALAPGLEALALKLALLADAVLPRRGGEIVLYCLLTEVGVDVAIKGAGGAGQLHRETLERLSALAAELGLARLSLDGEPVVTRARPRVRMGQVIVTPPPSAFLQATEAGEQALARLVFQALDGGRRVVDLFSGLGTFALRLAERSEVLAVEADEAMLAALKAAADGAGGARKQVSVLRRDLLRMPLSSLEMKKFDAAVIDPPRSGARLQCEHIARAPIRKLAYVSCDPASFARDLKVLVEHGFTVARVTPVDQFRWSPHVELVGALER